ncbi:sodium/hydrogen exchanger 1 isoform X2 [Physcomitrium patens]|uniref:Sodium/hydrogen exchanger n=1 Tax=Physcomitrium patens TaxID=3218 RepID=A0A2K1JVS5_PHYPA|nr:sodium/hydrogen exchanger 3-like [Physcomitrium patens]PNR45624.1 hypothetical protein PHYPA_015395 [Physcomitrium patens]|eukprot:XP_024389243.1 sodium/hydrogen exchanger 3-like [Physcomitrella patens]
MAMRALPVGSLHSIMAAVGIVDSGNHMAVVAVSLFVTLLCACIVLGHMMEEFQYISESVTAIFLGFCTGIVVLVTSSGASSHVLQFNEELFFIYLLPPIIFNAGFQVKKKSFFRNFVAIMLFGVIGVFISVAIITAGCKFMFPKLGLEKLVIGDYLALGTIFSATDSVCVLQVLNQDDSPLLYSLVFGEGVVNDATSVVLFRAVQKLALKHFTGMEVLQICGSFLQLFFSSTVLGVAIGLLSAYIIKTLYLARHSTDREIALMTIMAYLSYILAELFYLSGILTVFFCGIVMSHYTWHNVTESSRVTTKHGFATMSFIAETFIFLYVGMDALDVDKWNMVQITAGNYFGLFMTLIVLILVGRAAFVFPLSALSNYMRKSSDTKITFRQQIMIWWAGLMRGAVSIALAFNQFTSSGDAKSPEYAAAITITIGIVLFSLTVFGTATKPLMHWVLLPTSRSELGESEPNTPKDFAFADFHVPLLLGSSQQTGSPHPGPRRSSLAVLLSAPSNIIHDGWRSFDDGYMRPLFGGRGFVPYNTDVLTNAEDDAAYPFHSPFHSRS